MRRSFATCCYLLFSFFSLCATAIGAEIKVDSLLDSGAGTLRNAITTAANGDVILLRAEGILVLDPDPAKGAIPVTANITITGQGGPLAHTISGNNLTSLFSIASGATVTISRLTLESGVGTNGGAISSAGDLTLDSVRIINSSAAKGGAVYQSGSNLTVNKSYFLDNSTTSNGGAIYFGGDSLKVTSTGFELNSADGSGGAIAFAGATITIRNSTLTGNDAQVAGGGLAVLSGSGDAINLTLVNNTLNAGAPGSTLSHINVAGSGPLKIGNTIIEGTGAAPTDLPGISGSVTTAGTNLAGTATYLGLGALGDYGGVSPTYLLKPGSPAIDAGDSLLLPATDRDQRGLARFSDGNGDGLGDNPVDVGAFEIQHYQVTALQIRGSATGGVDDQGFGNPFDPSDDADSIASADVFVKLSKLGKADIGDAVGANNAAGGGSVSFGSKIVPGRIFLKGSELKVRRDVAIYGPGAKQMTIDGDARSPVMRVSEGAFAYVHGISLENGLATTGAGIVVESGGDVELDEVSVRGNVATTDGGGIAVLSGKSTVYRSALVENTAGQKGGGLYASSDSTVIIDTSTLSKNTAGTQGGGISAAGVLIIDSSALVDNTAVTSGPGLFMEDGIGTIQNSILSHAILPNAGADPIKVDSIKVEGGTVLSTGYNISDSTAAATDADLLVATGDKIVPTKPLLNLRGFNEGQTLSYAPTPESPAINAGKSFLPVVDGQLDQPGKKRVRGGVIDIGPVEFQNDPPIITILSAPSVVECSANNTATIKIRVQDPDGDLKSVTWSINGGTPVENVITPTPGTAQSIELTRTFALDQDFNYVVIKASDLVAVSTYNLAPIEVDDTTGPVFNTFPADQFIGTDSDSCSATFNPANYPATATDSCSASVQIQYAIGGSVIEETAHLPLGPTTVDVSATDDSGNTTLRSFILTVVDTTAPTISNVEDFNVSAAAYTTCGTSVDFGLGEEDVKDCSPVTLEYTLFDGTETKVIYSGHNFPIGVHTVTVTATDSPLWGATPNVATRTFKVTVADNTAPVITSALDIEVNANPEKCGAYVTFDNVTVEDCSPVDLKYTLFHETADEITVSSGDLFPLGIHTVTVTATDIPVAGTPNESTATFLVTVKDSTAPVLVSVTVGEETKTFASTDDIPEFTFSTDPGFCAAELFFFATATDDCAYDQPIELAYDYDYLITEETGESYPNHFGVGSHDITITATDANGNVSLQRTFRIIVEDPDYNCIFNVAWPNALDLDLFSAESSGTGASLAATTTLTGPTHTINQYIGLLDQSRWYKFKVEPGSRVSILLYDLPVNYDIVVYKDIAAEYQRLIDLLEGNTESKELALLGAEFASEQFSPYSFATDSFAPESIAPYSFAPYSFASENFSPYSFAPYSYAAENFSPYSFSPESIAPDAYSPYSYAPYSFAPYSYSGDEAAPYSFAPYSFSPYSFAPYSYAADGVSPYSYAPYSFSPYSYSAAQLASMVAFSAFPGVANEGLTINTFTLSGEFYVRVRGSNGAFSTEAPFTLSVYVEPGLCSEVTEDVGGAEPVGETVPGLETLILWDSTRMDLSDVGGYEAFDAKLQTFSSQVNGKVIDLGEESGQDPLTYVYVRVQNANFQADNNTSCPISKNIVAEEIKAVIDAWWKENPTLQYIVLLGNDEAIPFFRTMDEAALASESNYIPPVLDDSHSQSSLRYGNVLTQDPYGSRCEINLMTGPYPYPDLAVGRLVESASDIVGLLENYGQLTDGILPVPQTALVTGYDFLDDAANAVVKEFITALGDDLLNPQKVDSLISAYDEAPALGWTASDLIAQLEKGHDLIYLAGHFATGSALAADYETRLTASEVVALGVDFNNALIFSAGCHSGYNTVDNHAIKQVTQEPDWAQAFASMGAILIAGTGYQYGDTDFIEYGERLYLEFARAMNSGTGPVAIGKALNQAKQKYLAETPIMRGIHEKSLLQTTLFGLPMLKMNFPESVRLPSQPLGNALVKNVIPVTSTGPEDYTPGEYFGLATANVLITPSLVRAFNILDLTEPLQQEGGPDLTEVTAYYYYSDKNITPTNPGFISNPGEPVRPLESYLVAVDEGGYLLRGVGFRGGDYHDLNSVDGAPYIPLTGAPTTEIRGIYGNFHSEVFFPSIPYSMNYFGAICGGTEGERLNLFPTQFLGAGEGKLGGTLRKYDNMDFRLYYFNTSIDSNFEVRDGIAPALSPQPTISRVRSAIVDPLTKQAEFQVTVVGSPYTGIQEVWITYTAMPDGNGAGVWQSLDLTQDATDTTLWTGQLDLPNGLTDWNSVRFMVQAASGTGMVALNSNYGHYFEVGVDDLVAKTPTSIALNPAPVAGELYATRAYGETLPLSATVTDEAGNPLVGKQVIFSAGTSSITVSTKEGGIASANLTLRTRPADGILLQASFPGNSEYAPSSTNTTINVTKQATGLEFAPVPIWAYGSDIIVTLSDSNGVPLRERTVFFYLDYADPQVDLGYPVITDYSGRADLSGIPIPAGENVTITAYFNGVIRIPATDPADYPEILDDRYLASDPVAVTVNLANPLLEDALLFKPQQVDIHYASSGNGRNATEPLYSTASVAGEIAFNKSLQPSDLLKEEGQYLINATVVAYLAGEMIASETVQLDTRGDNGNHWTTTSRPGQQVNYVGIHWVDAPRFDTAFTSEPGPRIYTSYIGNNFTDIHFIPVAGEGNYETTLPDGTVIKVGADGSIAENSSTALKNRDYVIDEEGLTLYVRFGLELGDTFTTTGLSPDQIVVTVNEGNYVVEGGNMIIRMDAVAGTPTPSSSATPNLFEFRFFLGGVPNLVETSSRVGEGEGAVPWTSEDPGHKQYRP